MDTLELAVNLSKQTAHLNLKNKGAHSRYLVEIFGDQTKVLGMCARGNGKNVNSFEKLMNKMYDVHFQY